MTNILDMYYKSGYNNRREVSSLDLNKEKDRNELDRIYRSKLDKTLEDISIIEETNNKISELIEKDIYYLENKINKVVEKVKGAILVERKTTSTIYSTIVPINEQQTNKQTTSATIKENVIFGVPSTEIKEEDITTLTINNISFKNLNIKKVSKGVLKNTIISNLTHNTLPFEFQINLNNLVSNTSNIILDLGNYAIIEVYKNNSLIKEKELNNYFNIPVTKDDETVTIRSYPTIHKVSDLYINNLGISEYIYQENTVYESKEIPINDTFSYLVLDTCDNTQDNNIQINYSISINDKEYERVNTTNNFADKNNMIQSVINLSKDDELTLLPLSGTKKSEGDIQYFLPNDIQNQVSNDIEVYIKNTRKVKKESLWLLIKEDTLLIKSYLTSYDIYIDNQKITEDSFLIPKGFRNIILTGTYNYDYLEKITNESIFSNKLIKPILIINDFKYVSLNSMELLNSNSTITIEDIYIKNIKKDIYLNTIKIKADLISLDKRTVPFISRFLIRGI